MSSMSEDQAPVTAGDAYSMHYAPAGTCPQHAGTAGTSILVALNRLSGTVTGLTGHHPARKVRMSRSDGSTRLVASWLWDVPGCGYELRRTEGREYLWCRREDRWSCILEGTGLGNLRGLERMILLATGAALPGQDGKAVTGLQ